MPVILDPASLTVGFPTRHQSPSREDGRPVPAEKMRTVPVSKTVNSVKNVGPECIEPLEAGVV